MGRADPSRPSRASTTLLFMGWAGDNGDPDNYLSPLFSCNAVKSGINFARFCDPQLDKLIADGKATPDLAKRTKAYAGCATDHPRSGAWIPLAYPTAAALTRDQRERLSREPVWAAELRGRVGAVIPHRTYRLNPKQPGRPMQCNAIERATGAYRRPPASSKGSRRKPHHAPHRVRSTRARQPQQMQMRERLAQSRRSSGECPASA